MPHLTEDDAYAIPLPASLQHLIERVLENQEAVAAWLGGSFGQGTADVYSDVDLRIAVRPEALAHRDLKWLHGLFAEEIVAEGSLSLPDGMLYNLLLANGDLYDVWIQSSCAEPDPERVRVLACRDEALAQKLACLRPPEQTADRCALPEAVREMLVLFWMNSLKHAKTLYRSALMVTQVGLSMERELIRRLWYIEATGRDPGHRTTIHTLTGIAREIAVFHGDRALQMLGLPVGTAEDARLAVETHRDEVSRTGRALAGTLGFEYPTRAEETVRRHWAGFLENGIDNT